MIHQILLCSVTLLEMCGGITLTRRTAPLRALTLSARWAHCRLSAVPAWSRRGESRKNRRQGCGLQPSARRLFRHQAVHRAKKKKEFWHIGLRCKHMAQCESSKFNRSVLFFLPRYASRKEINLSIKSLQKLRCLGRICKNVVWIGLVASWSQCAKEAQAHLLQSQICLKIQFVRLQKLCKSETEKPPKVVIDRVAFGSGAKLDCQTQSRKKCNPRCTSSVCLRTAGLFACLFGSKFAAESQSGCARCFCSHSQNALARLISSGKSEWCQHLPANGVDRWDYFRWAEIIAFRLGCKSERSVRLG